MQKFILIPEIPVIIRKIAPDGNHFAYWEDSGRSRDHAAIWLRRLQSGEAPYQESNLSWTTRNQFDNSKTITTTFLENSNVC